MCLCVRLFGGSDGKEDGHDLWPRVVYSLVVAWMLKN